MVVIDAMIINKSTHAHNDDVRATTPEARPRRTHAITRLEWTHAITRLEWTQATTRPEGMLQREKDTGACDMITYRMCPL